jgi:hypothetical protein
LASGHLQSPINTFLHTNPSLPTATEALAAGFYCLGKFADFKIEGQELASAFIEKAPALAKVNVVAGTALL